MAVEQPAFTSEKATCGGASRGHEPLSPTGEPFSARSGGRYVRLELHDQGGMGRVWVARDTGLDRKVALKELHPDLAENPTALSRFLREAQITGIASAEKTHIWRLGRTRPTRSSQRCMASLSW